MKKITIICSLLLVCALLFSSCSDVAEGFGIGAVNKADGITDSTDNIQSVSDTVPKVVNAALFNDASSVSLIKMLDDSAAVTGSEYVFGFQLEINADELSSKLISGEIDIAAVPVQLAVKLYNQTEGGIVMLAINSYGIQRTAQNSEPDDNNNEAEPAADLYYVSGVTVASKDFAENNPDAVKAFLAGCSASAEYANVNRDAAVTLMNKYGFVDSDIAGYVLSDINIAFVGGDEMKAMFSEYVGSAAADDIGAAPGEDFYYTIE